MFFFSLCPLFSLPDHIPVPSFRTTIWRLRITLN